MNVAFLFPGQGSQVPGMLHTLSDHPTISRTLDVVSETLKQNVLQLDSPEALRSTVSVQLALLTSGVAVARTLIARVLEGARKSGARTAVRLDVSAPSHCPLLKPVAVALTENLQSIHLQEPKFIYVGNVTGRALRTAEAISKDLANNIAHGVRWYDSTTVLVELGCRLFLEMPPGHVLSELGRKAFPDVRTLAVGETSLQHALQLAASSQ